MQLLYEIEKHDMTKNGNNAYLEKSILRKISKKLEERNSDEKRKKEKNKKKNYTHLINQKKAEIYIFFLNFFNLRI